MIGIYKIRNKLNNKTYIGESMNVERRWEEHRNDLNSGVHHSWKLQEDWNNHGEDNFEFSFIKKYNSYRDVITMKSFLIILEYKYIEKYDSIINGYNVENTYDMIKSNKKGVVSQDSNKYEYMIFKSVETILFIKDKIPDSMFDNNGYMVGWKFMRLISRSKNNNNIYNANVVNWLGSKLSLKSCYSNKEGGCILNEHLAKFVKISNREVYVHKDYMDEVISHWIKTHVNCNNGFKATNDVKINNIHISNKKSVFDMTVGDVIDKLNDFGFEQEITIAKLCDCVGLSRKLVKVIKQEMHIDTNIEKSYENGFYTKTIKGIDRDYIGVFASKDSIKYIINMLELNRDDKMIAKKLRDTFYNF